MIYTTVVVSTQTIQKREEQRREEKDSSRAVLEAVQAQTDLMKATFERQAAVDERRLQMEEEKSKGMTAMMLAIAERLGPKPASDGK